MKTTLNLSDELLQEASKRTGIQEKTKLIHVALQSLIQEYDRKQILSLFGSDKKAKPPRRTRS
jgi:Arc/MetJ family transcription regulator